MAKSDIVHSEHLEAPRTGDTRAIWRCLLLSYMVTCLLVALSFVTQGLPPDADSLNLAIASATTPVTSAHLRRLSLVTPVQTN